MMPNNPMDSIRSLVSQCGNNPQAMVQTILRNNPEFARSLQGQNPQLLAMKELRDRGIDPQLILQMIRK